MAREVTKSRVAASAESSASAEDLRALVEVISRSQQGYRDLVDHLDQAVFTLSLDGEIRAANRRLCEMFGVNFQGLIGHHLDEFIASPPIADAKKLLSQFIRQGTWECTLPVRLRHNPALRYFKCWLMAVVESGEVASISGWARDVTAQHESETRFSEFFESLREGLFFSTLDGVILDANPALVRLLGYDSKEDLQRINLRQIYADPATRDALVQEILQKGAVQDREIILRKRDESRVHCLASGFAVRDAAGNVLRLQGTLVDFTERLEIERRLHQEQEFVRRLVASIPDMIAVLDLEGRFTYVSQRVQDALGYPPDKLVGQTLGGRAHPDDQPEMLAKFRQVIAGTIPDAQIEYRSRHIDGSWRTLRASAGPLFDESGKISGVVATARDVTELVQFEQQTAQKEKFAAMGQMMTGAAHELNNPLTAILGVSELIRERAGDEGLRRHADLVHSQARRAAGIVQDLLAFSRPAIQGRLPISLADLAREAIQSRMDLLRQKNVAVEFAASPDLPAVAGDRKLLLQVFCNLIDNAEQSISSGRGAGTLKVSVARNEERICVTFADDGPGVPPQILRKIFDPFFTTKRPGGGSGLGLTICLAVIKDHGGTMEVQSAPGQGAEFRILFPVVAGALGDQETDNSLDEKMATPDEPLRGYSVLIVDDEESIREIVEEGLSARGVKTDGAGSSEEALSHLAANSYDVVLCDVNLPRLSGAELFRRLRSQSVNQAPQFVFMSGDLIDGDAMKDIRENGARVIQKPFHISALVSLLTEILKPHPSRLSLT